jgi:hypothetical protein
MTEAGVVLVRIDVFDSDQMRIAAETLRLF